VAPSTYTIASGSSGISPASITTASSNAGATTITGSAFTPAYATTAPTISASAPARDNRGSLRTAGADASNGAVPAARISAFRGNRPSAATELSASPAAAPDLSAAQIWAKATYGLIGTLGNQTNTAQIIRSI